MLSHAQNDFSLQTFIMLQRRHLLFFLDLKRNHDHRFMKEIVYIFLTATWLPNGQLWATVEGGGLTKPMLMTAFVTYST